MNRKQLYLAKKVQAAYVLGCDEVSLLPPGPPAPPVCCCPNQGQPDKDGYLVRNAGCQIHGISSVRPEDR
jgi:hypothetical protein